ncbi:H-type small acid-soluble spore protein [Niallia sp. 01092]|uniref:H-type small acid-soluble spore protein n=1 Tax=unclassified Niallia TaxID=2837522 RepID=UPI003FD58EF2
MNIGRAIEIMTTGDIINVRYQGESVIIQHVDENAKTARIYPKANPDQEMEVNVQQLSEEQ